MKPKPIYALWNPEKNEWVTLDDLGDPEGSTMPWTTTDKEDATWQLKEYIDESGELLCIMREVTITLTPI